MRFKSVERFTLYGGGVVMEFDHGRHRYYVTDKANGLERELVPGVTTVLSVLARPALVNWAAGQAAEYIQDNLRPGAPLDEVEIEELAKGARWAHRRTKDRAATVGTVVHSWIEKYVERRIVRRRSLQPLPQNPQARAGVEAFLSWVDEHDVHFRLSEQRLYSRRYRYAGTADIVAEVDGALTLIDIKTSKGVYPEYELQLAAYWQALAEEGWFQGAFEQAVVVKVGKEDGEFNVVPMFDAEGFERSFQVFESLLVVYGWQQERKGRA